MTEFEINVIAALLTIAEAINFEGFLRRTESDRGSANPVQDFLSIRDTVSAWAAAKVPPQSTRDDPSEPRVDFATLNHYCRKWHTTATMPENRGTLQQQNHVGWANHMRQWHYRLSPSPECDSECAGLVADEVE